MQKVIRLILCSQSQSMGYSEMKHVEYECEKCGVKMNGYNGVKLLFNKCDVFLRVLRD